MHVYIELYHFIILTGYKQDAPRDCEIVLCANKTDLPVEMWEVSREQFTLFAQENNLPVFETSASSGSNVEEV